MSFRTKSKNTQNTQQSDFDLSEKCFILQNNHLRIYDDKIQNVESIVLKWSSPAAIEVIFAYPTSILWFGMRYQNDNRNRPTYLPSLCTQ